MIVQSASDIKRWGRFGISEEFKHFIHHGVCMILRLTTANENLTRGRPW